MMNMAQLAASQAAAENPDVRVNTGINPMLDPLAAAAQINPTGQLEETRGLARNRFDARMNGTAVERAVESAMPNNAVTLTQQQAVAGITGGFATELAVDPNLHNRTT